jgi:hypothetical protein
MNATNIEQTGLCNHQHVTVKGNGGHMDNIEIIISSIYPSTAFMFYPEVNAHISRIGYSCLQRIFFLGLRRQLVTQNSPAVFIGASKEVQ